MPISHRFALALLPGALFAAAPAWAAESTGFVSATVVGPLSVEALADLDFGSVGRVGAEGGALFVTPGNGPVRYAGGARSTCATGERGCALPHAARLRVTGEPGRAYRVVMPESVQARGSEGLPALPVTGLTVRTDSRPQAGAQGVLDPRGADGIEIGGELRIPAGTAASHYRAQVAVIVVYG